MLDTVTENPNQSVIDSCRAFASFLERYNGLPKVSVPEFCAYWYWSADDVKEHMQDLAQAGAAHGMKVEQDYSSSFYRLYLRNEGFHFKAVCQREDICTRTEVGTETVTEERLPTGVQYETVEVERPVYEWTCDPLTMPLGTQTTRND